eukprot:20469-Ditylum_brightwellii.AAC.1
MPSIGMPESMPGAEHMPLQCLLREDENSCQEYLPRFRGSAPRWTKYETKGPLVRQAVPPI